jgi:hypothetical protein
MIGKVWIIRSVAEIAFFRLGQDGASWRLAVFLALSALYLVPALFSSARRTGGC